MCGSIFGGGKVSTPEVQKVDPSVTNVTSSEVSDSDGDTESTKKKRRQQGFAATRLSTLLSSAGSNNKQTLG